MRLRVLISLVLLASLPPAAQGQPASGGAERERLQRAWQVNQADAAATRRDIALLQRQLVQLAAVQAGGERSSGDKRARLAFLNTRESELAGRLGRNRHTLARLLGALQLYRRDPPPALLTHPGSARDAVRAVILVRAMAPELERRGEVLAAEATEIQRVRREVAAASEDLFSSDSELAERRARIEGLIAQKTALERTLLADAAAAEQALAAMAKGSSSVAELMARLPARAQIDLQRAPNAGLVAPVQGSLVRRFGGASRGWTWAAGQGAMVRAPATGLVEYAGPLKGYGVILILRVGGGYHLILTGLEAAQAVPGNSVTAGEPVGRMAGKATGTQGGETSEGKPSPELYLELRKDGAPVDPAPWLSPAVASR
jgi:murein hydrolase activator